jgi:hypothetical protein
MSGRVISSKLTPLDRQPRNEIKLSVCRWPDKITSARRDRLRRLASLQVSEKRKSEAIVKIIE